jgi:RNA polymerase sigma factor (sigma-70 family)
MGKRCGVDSRTYVLYNKNATRRLVTHDDSRHSAREVCVLFRRRLSEPRSSEEKASSEEGLILEVTAELSAKLRQLAQAAAQSQQALAAELLARAVQREARHRRTAMALERLTPREREVVRLAARGLTNQQIARALVVAPETVKTHVRHALEKLGVRSKTELRLLLLDASP